MENINVFLRVDINVIAIIMLLLVYLLAFRRLEKQDSLNRLFNKVSLLVVLQLCVETLTCIINRRPELWLIPISVILHIILFVLSPVLTCYWFYLIHKIIFPNDTYLKKHRILFILPVIFNSILTILSPFYGFIYSIDSFNVYHRGRYFFIGSSISYFYIIYGLIIIFINRKRLPKQDFYLLLVFNILPIIGGIIQTVTYGPLLIWSCTAFSLVIAFIFLQQRMVHLDDLTGAWDRGSFDFYITQKIQYLEQKFGLIYVDIDKLKEINDSYGHKEGDIAIKMSVDLIRKEIQKNDIIVRMGGDEFLIIVECKTMEYLNHTIDRIAEAFKQHNLKTSKNYQLECSFGGGIYDPEDNVGIDQLIDHIDTLMYRNKNRKRALFNNK